jgi:hypothetical protein
MLIDVDPRHIWIYGLNLPRQSEDSLCGILCLLLPSLGVLVVCLYHDLFLLPFCLFVICTFSYVFDLCLILCICGFYAIFL